MFETRSVWCVKGVLTTTVRRPEVASTSSILLRSGVRSRKVCFLCIDVWYPSRTNNAVEKNNTFISCHHNLFSFLLFGFFIFALNFLRSEK